LGTTNKDSPLLPPSAENPRLANVAELRVQDGGFWNGLPGILVEFPQTFSPKQKNAPPNCHFLPFLGGKFVEGVFFKKFVQPTKSYIPVTFETASKIHCFCIFGGFRGIFFPILCI
jgi:hypothetical protein